MSSSPFAAVVVDSLSLRDLLSDKSHSGGVSRSSRRTGTLPSGDGDSRRLGLPLVVGEC